MPNQINDIASFKSNINVFIGRGYLETEDANAATSAGLYYTSSIVANAKYHGFILTFVIGESAILQFNIPWSGDALAMRTKWWDQGWSTWLIIKQ